MGGTLYASGHNAVFISNTQSRFFSVGRIAARRSTSIRDPPTALKEGTEP